MAGDHGVLAEGVTLRPGIENVMPTVNVVLVKRSVVIDLTDDGTDVVKVRIVSEARRDGTANVGVRMDRTYTKAEAGAAGVTGAQLTAFLAAAETLRADHSTDVFGAP